MPSHFFIVGLGNPGREYEWTRHNLGFMVVDLLARQVGARIRSEECRSLIGRAELEGRRVKFVKPQTYMNLSGEAVACLARKREGFDPRRDLLVICDDLALPLGKIRLRARGSSGGHNGLKSIIAALGTEEFMRLRIGIKPDHPVADAAAFVLERFPRDARATVERVVERSAEAIRAVLRDGIERAMAIYNADP
ncbi:aminoacyl-tRNA hydrolase [Pyrinomonas methylaliphatogenes]|uniref:Peptidyl-tRNA hydrolase n=1 Tax=Pyrinomonas methylaliphatogenes TaxID=454194 RepID=A0A0B6WXC4_9BACT|nr:aminoacyl-tRNA hydrolase [Pyrinomonas methylaliphatogenes]MBX5479127.1 aminoacyl-tRNA hydrolase [Pyrinomonas methylaliphatogenes]CDM64939.1 peptidyl-tRNA hydrolase [Pyrinomonas methylaliphatogenes]